MRVKQPLPQRVNRIARKLARRAEKRKDAKRVGSKPMRRKELRLRRRLMIAYDLETTRIKAGETPRPLYLTAYGEGWQCSARLADLAQLRDILIARFLTFERHQTRFVAWNGNNFDVYLIAQALLESGDYTLRPYLTRSKNLRGLRVLARHKVRDKRKGRDVRLSWEFLDGIAMTGLVGMSLKKFLAQFAPDYGKLQGPDFEHGEDFDAGNPDHVRYAERDSEGLYHGMQAVEAITVASFGIALAPTIGNLGIKVLQANLPANVTLWKPSFGCLEPLRAQVLRGGYCYAARRHDGALWKYDLNSAYPSAMRDARLPAGACYWNPPVKWKVGNVNPYARTFVCQVRGTHAANKVPFYCRNMEGEPAFATDVIPETWITSIEYQQLSAEGARLEVLQSYFWDEDFSMREFVDRLERLRAESPGGPSGPQGTVVKMIGNTAYGKTAERLDGLDIVMALECPEGFSSYQAEDDRLKYVWYRFADPVLREYHQPQLAAFITAHVRMLVRRAILKAPDAWLYADTDCVAFDRPVALDVDPKRYGAWKLEESGTEFYVIEKKVYAAKDGRVKHAKGMNVKKLTVEDFARWHAGQPPKQAQIHRQNFVKFIRGEEMFTARSRVGQRLASG